MRETAVTSYRSAIDWTTESIVRRAHSFRNHVLTMGVVTAGAMACALAMASSSPLWAGLLLIPVCAGLLLADVRLLDRWRCELLCSWAKGEIDLAAFVPAVSSNALLPQQTLTAMLATLPRTGELVAEQAIDRPTRVAIAAVFTWRQQKRTDALLMKVAASAVLVMALAAWIWSRSRLPLIALAALPPLGAVLLWLAARRRAECDAKVGDCRMQPGFDAAAYERIRATLP